MKKFILLVFLVGTGHIAFSQDIDVCRSIVDATLKGINDHSSENLQKYLAPNFSIAGQKGEMAKMVLTQLFTQLDETVQSSEVISEKKENGTLTSKYSIAYAKMGTREATFLFNEQNLLQELSLFSMEVKTVNSTSEVQQTSSDIIQIPFQMAGNLIAVDVELNGEKRSFILDSGSPKVILNSRLSVSPKTTQRKLSSAKGVNGTISGMDIQNVESIDFKGIQMVEQDILTLDLAHLEEELGQEIYGLVGFELIKAYDILFDYQEQMLTLIKPDAFRSFKTKNLANNRLTQVPIKMQGHIPVVEARIDNKRYSFGIDCGAETNLIDEDVLPALKKMIVNRTTDSLTGADNIKKKVEKGDIKRMDIENKTFISSSTLFSDISHLNKAYKLQIDGLIGFPILSKQKTLLSFARQELIFIE